MTKINVAVIGTGNMGKNHVRVYSKISSAVLLSVCDLNGSAAKEVAKSCGAKWYSDYKEMFENEREIDAVSIVVPTAQHEKIALDAIDYGKHIFVEKPIATSLESATRIVKKAEKAGVKLMVGHIERFNPAVLRIKELIDANELGQLVSISAKRVGPFANTITDVGVCLDLAIHDIDVIRYITNDEISEVYAKTGCGIHPHEDYASILLTLKNGATGIIETNWLTPTKIRRLDITGRDGFAALDYISQEICLYGKAASNHLSDCVQLSMAHGMPQMARIKPETKEPLQLELSSFLQSIISNTLTLVDGWSGIENLKVALAAVQSVKEQRPIKFKDEAYT